MEAILRRGDTSYLRVEKTLPTGYLPTDPEVLALNEVLNRLAPLQPIQFPDTSASDLPAITSYEVFPFGVDHEWLWENIDSPPREKVVLVFDQDEDRWIFSEETLKKAPALLDSMFHIAPIYPERNDRDFLDSIFSLLAKKPHGGDG